MKFSEQWLREWINPSIMSEALAKQLTMSGLEVESIEPVANQFSKVVIGEVLQAEQHPDADRLRVCQVNVGDHSSTPLTIVCGAPNVSAGLKVAVALVGAVLGEEFKIKKSKLRGVESHGMICSTQELGLTEDSDGTIMELPSDAPVGSDFRHYLKLDDVSIELGLTPNRGDCLSIAGIAREVGVLNKMDVSAPVMQPVPPLTDDTIAVTVSAPSECLRYFGRVIKGINPKAKTPTWMSERLRRSGIRSICPAVDVTNYVMIELGQPLHAFDADKLNGDIDVRLAKQGEQLTLLDNKKLELTADTLVIADQSGPTALAGIMGGEDSAVSAQTTTIFLESATFDANSIRNTCQRFGLHTDGSHRHERGIDFTMQGRALERATQLILTISGGQAGAIVDVSNTQFLPTREPITLRASRISKILGTDIPNDTVTEILKRLGAQVDVSGDSWQVTPPVYRFDLELEIDLVEEVARIYGYNQLPSRNSLVEFSHIKPVEAVNPVTRIKNTLVERDFHEIVSYSFISPELQNLLAPGQAFVELTNPISTELSVMRTNLWSGLIKTLQYNRNRQIQRVRLFEIGNCYFPAIDNEPAHEQIKIAALVCGPKYPEQWAENEHFVDFFDLKGDLEALCDLTGQREHFTFISAEHPALHPGQSAQVLKNGTKVGWLGALHPATLQKLDLEGPVFVFELTLDCVIKGQVPTYSPISKYPAISRDIAVLVEQSVTAQAIQEVIRTSAGELLQEVSLFDVYQGENIPENKKSLALNLILQAQERTLTDEEVAKVMTTVISNLSQQLDAELRE